MSVLSKIGPWRGLGIAFALLILVFPVLSDDLYYQNMIILSLVFAIGAVGLNIISGYGGYISLGQSAFIGIGAYTIGLGALKVGGSPWIWVPIAAALSSSSRIARSPAPNFVRRIHHAMRTDRARSPSIAS